MLKIFGHIHAVIATYCAKIFGNSNCYDTSNDRKLSF